MRAFFLSGIRTFLEILTQTPTKNVGDKHLTTLQHIHR